MSQLTLWEASAGFRADSGATGHLPSLARAAPRALARNLEMTARISSLPTAMLGEGRRLHISLKVAGHHQAMTKVWFGDGTSALQRSTFFHTYRRPGSYRAVGVVLANATVYRFSFRVTVGGRHGVAATTIQVPSHTPNIHPVPPLPPPPPTPKPE